MTDLPLPDWAALAPEARFCAPDEFRSKQTMFEKRIRRRNMVEYAAGALVIAVFGWVGWLTFSVGEYFVSTSWFAMIACTVVVLLNLRRVGSPLPHNPEISCQAHLRAQMVHQHKAISSVGRWYIGPFIPGMFLVFAAMAELTARTTGWVIALGGISGPAVFSGGIMLFVAWLNRRAARDLAIRIAELDRLASA
ncbi:hypothetical protein QWY75_04360 [Pontixanthobacter aestiaquae]|uniref:Uncharacterized protein n=1 Tax=Pontixanthobacter aestiaquae TaxID=1509367 RepID=A0A844ZCL5_9SPHN|nr:hypothetical protein [Pontixanthobacter aestiaquae]MDN3645441.1 hypothetical protein [Pontixanthobacter aestiaquae]MXO83559.1 hypothetical protein [Pontixanthobacter aestiaquae]